MKIVIYEGLPDEAKQIRQTVFVEEQGFHEEFDQTDDAAVHFVVYWEDDLPVATCRVFWDTAVEGYVLGRIAVLKEYRDKDIGSAMIKEAEKYVQKAGGRSLSLHAQCQVSGFYRKRGFAEYGEVEYEQKCPHVWMKKHILPDSLTVNGREYSILKLLGKGKGGYSYLALDGDKKVVLKQIHHEPCAYYQFGDKLEAELRDYKRLQGIGIPMPELIDFDRQTERIVKEYIAGETVYEMVLREELPDVCRMQIKEMCRLLYPADTNIDYFPTNFVWQDETLYYIDYECNDYMEEWSFENWGIKYWSKTPEFLKYVEEH